MAWLDLAISTLSIIFYSLKWALFTTLSVTFNILHLAAWPVARLWNVLLFVCAPVIYTVRFILSPLLLIINNFPRLEPLYIYFGSAAFIGLTCGLILTLTTSTTFSLLGLYDKPSSALYSPPASAQHTQFSTKSKDDSRPNTPITPGSDLKELDLLLAGISSSPESDHLIALAGSGAGWRDPPNTKRKRRSASGVGLGVGASRFSTILEEDDDSL